MGRKIKKGAVRIVNTQLPADLGTWLEDESIRKKTSMTAIIIMALEEFRDKKKKSVAVPPTHTVAETFTPPPKSLLYQFQCVVYGIDESDETIAAGLSKMTGKLCTAERLKDLLSGKLDVTQDHLDAMIEYRDMPKTCPELV